LLAARRLRDFGNKKRTIKNNFFQHYTIGSKWQNIYMDTENLSISFLEIEKKLLLSEYLQKICSAIINKSISKKSIDEILQNHNINYSIAKVEFLHLIFEYIKNVLEDNILTIIEKENIKYLKTLFRVQPGDFYLHNKSDIEATIAYQLARIYQDNYITDTEALLKVDLQEMFDLSFDQMNEYAKVEASASIKKGADVNNLDVFFTHKEFFNLK
jgi:hypothetical protein